MIRGEGPSGGLMLVGEKPGFEEVKVGRSFVGQNGRLLNWFLDGAGLKRRDVYTTNVLKQLPKSQQEITVEEIERDTPALLEEIDRVKPKYIYAAGQTAVKWFFGPGFDVDMYHGFDPQSSSIRKLPSSVKAIMPGYHPVHALHDQDLIPYIQEDFNTFGKLSEGGRLTRSVDQWPDATYKRLSNDDILELEDIVFNQPYLSIDTEGTKEDPICLSLCNEEGSGYVIWFDLNSRLLVQHLMNLIRRCDTLVVLHNSMWDLEVLAAVGIEEFHFVDTMVMAYLCNEVSQGLKSLSFRHCGMVMEDYQDVVGPYTRRLQLEFLHDMSKIDWGKSEPVLLIEKGKQRIKQPQSLNNYINRILIDLDKKHGDLDIKKRWSGIDENVLAPLQDRRGESTLPEATLRDVPIEKAVYYAGRDADATLRLYLRHLLPATRKLRLQGTLDLDMGAIPMFNRMQRNGIPANVQYFKDLTDELQSAQGKIRFKIENMVGRSINPESSQQVAELLFDDLGLISHKKTKAGRPSTNEKAVESLRDVHPVVPLILDHREMDKLRTSFCAVIIKKAEKDDDHVVRGKINTTRVSSGRPSMQDPNLLAIPVRTKLGQKIRHGFIAPDGEMFYGADLSQIEMRYMADESEDPNLIRMFNEGADIHSITAARMFGLPDALPKDKGGSVDELLHRYPAKRVAFGVITGITGAGLLDQFRLNNLTTYDEDDCDGMIKEWFKMYGKVQRYMLWCRQQARRDGYVRDRWGRYRILHGIWSPIPKLVAEAERQSHSHKIQGGAQGIEKLAMAELWEYRFDLRNELGAEPILQIYDELVWLVKEDLVKTLHNLVLQVLCNVVKLKVPVKAAGHWSKTWGGLK